MSSKRSYTVPVLLLIIMVLMTMLIMVYSKLLIAQQKQTTDEGKRLAEQYVLANAFAERLSEGTNLMLKDTSMADRLRGKQLLGEAAFPSLETVGILTEASHRSSGQAVKEAFKPISIAMTEIIHQQNGKMSGIGEHDGLLTQEERTVLMKVHDGAVKMTDALHRFRPPTGEAGFRQMTAGGDWVASAMDAVKALEDTAAALKKQGG
ncbi:MAG: hypothetical protein JWR03_2569 [Cohnella sp.]|nr:hypothetical protein [Cohnella sp.]